jgi:hypothetical protein
MVLAIIGAMVLSVTGTTVATWSGDAGSSPEIVHSNFLERLKVEVHNNGTAAMEVRSITYSIMWSGSTVLYEVFTGSAMVEAGGAQEFVGQAVRMPDEVEGDYRYTIAVLAVGADGQAQERKFTGTISLQPFSLSFMGIPEAILVPSALGLFAVLSTLAFFMIKRTATWPFLRSEPRLSFHRSRRTKP